MEHDQVLDLELGSDELLPKHHPQHEVLLLLARDCDDGLVEVLGPRECENVAVAVVRERHFAGVRVGLVVQLGQPGSALLELQQIQEVREPVHAGQHVLLGIVGVLLLDGRHHPHLEVVEILEHALAGHFVPDVVQRPPVLPVLGLQGHEEGEVEGVDFDHVVLGVVEVVAHQSVLTCLGPVFPSALACGFYPRELLRQTFRL